MIIDGTKNPPKVVAINCKDQTKDYGEVEKTNNVVAFTISVIF